MLLLVVVLLASARAQVPPIPSQAQVSFMNRGPLTMFQHFGPCTFADCQWDRQPAPPSVFTPPDDMNTDQWFETASLMGASEVCLTVRHVDGFTLWPSASTNYSVAASPWRGGKGDVVADFVASAKRFGIAPCFYIILGFNFYANKTGVPAAEYLTQQKTVLTELLTNYGPISRLWWDNYGLDGTQYQPVTHEGFVCPGNTPGPACPAWGILSDLVRTLSPHTAIVPGPDGCLVNAETLDGSYPLFHAAAEGTYWCTTDATPSTSGQFVVIESDFSIENPGDNWFWNPNLAVMNVADVWSTMTLKGAQGAHVILNVPPNSTGMVPDSYVAVVASYGAVFNGTYAHPVAAMASPTTGQCPGLSITIPVPPSAVFDQILLSEDMSSGQVVTSYSIEAEGPSGWRNLNVMHGHTIGTRLVDWGLGNVTNVSALRFNCTSSLSAGAVARIVTFAACLGAQIP